MNIQVPKFNQYKIDDMFNDLKAVLGPYEREVKYLLKACPNRYNTYLLAYDGHVSKMLI